MTPNFALSLSFDGIRLLHRVPGGWHLVGEAAIDDPDLSARLAMLRQTALALEPGGLRTKLLIPPEQIKFMAIDTAQTSDDDVMAALDGATPYAIADLEIDIDRNGGRTHVAAVARETLEEAEAFATEHRFHPVAFVAIAEPFTFQGEVFFGPTSQARADGEVPVRDDLPVKVIGTAEIAQPEQVEKGEAKETVLAADAAPEGAPVDLDDFEAAGDAAPDMEDATAEVSAEVAPEVDEIDEDEDDDEDDAEPVVFSSRSRDPDLTPRPTTETIGILERATVKARQAEPSPGGEPAFSRRREPPQLAVPTGMTEGPAVAAPQIDLPDAPPRPVAAEIPDPVTAPPLTGTPDQAAGTDTTFEPVRALRSPAPVNAERGADRAEAAPLAVFGTQQGAARNKPRFLALKLTAALILALVLIALWAGTLSDNGLAGWFGGTEETPTEIAVAEAPATVEEAPLAEVPEPVNPVVLAEPEATPAPSALQPEIETAAASDPPPLPVVRAPTGRVLSPAEANRIYAATGVWQRAPRFPVDPREETLDGFRESAVILAGDRPERLQLPPNEAQFADLPLREQRNPPPPGTRYQRDLRGFILARPEGVVTPDGAVVFAGAPEILPPLRPGTEIVAPETPVAPFVAENGEGLILVAGPPPRVPPLRPEGLVPETPASVPDADEEASAETIAVAEAEVLAEPEEAIAAAAPAPAAEETTPEVAVADLPVVEAETEAASAPEALAEVTAPAVDPGQTPGAADPAVAAASLLVQNELAALSTRSVPPTIAEGVEEELNLIAGRPSVVPPLRPETAPEGPDADPEAAAVILAVGPATLRPQSRPGTAPDQQIEAAVAAAIAPVQILAPGAERLAAFRPSLRPASVVARAPRPVFSDPALAGVRPNLRPGGLAPAAPDVPEAPDMSTVLAAIAEAAPPSAFVNVTPRAVATSARPDARPRNFAQVVASAQSRIARQQSSQAAAPQATEVRVAPAQPSGPIPGGVARAATQTNAISLREVNLIGVYGRPGDRRALVRLGNGRYVKVEVGSSLDGGRVTAIGDSALNYVKRGRTLALQLPSS